MADDNIDTREGFEDPPPPPTTEVSPPTPTVTPSAVPIPQEVEAAAAPAKKKRKPLSDERKAQLRKQLAAVRPKGRKKKADGNSSAFGSGAGRPGGAGSSEGKEDSELPHELPQADTDSTTLSPSSRTAATGDGSVKRRYVKRTTAESNAVLQRTVREQAEQFTSLKNDLKAMREEDQRILKEMMENFKAPKPIPPKAQVDHDGKPKVFATPEEQRQLRKSFAGQAEPSAAIASARHQFQESLKTFNPKVCFGKSQHVNVLKTQYVPSLLNKGTMWRTRDIK